MRSALAELDGIDAEDCSVDYDAKTVAVNTDGTSLTAADLIGAFEGTRFTATAH